MSGIEFKTKLGGQFKKYGRMKCRKICVGNNEKKLNQTTAPSA